MKTGRKKEGLIQISSSPPPEEKLETFFILNQGRSGVSKKTFQLPLQCTAKE